MERATRGRRTSGPKSTVALRPGMVFGALVILMALTVGPSARAGSATSVTDPVGDALLNAPGYMDIVDADATKRGQTFRFQMSLAEPIPAAPPRTPPGANQIQWDWALDTDPTTSPAGYPFPIGTGPRPAEFVLVVAWDGSAFSAYTLDRRPLLNGGEAVRTPLPFTISGAVVRVDVRASAIGDPAGFGWGPVTFAWSSPPGSSGGNFVDFLDPFYHPYPS